MNRKMIAFMLAFALAFMDAFIALGGTETYDDLAGIDATAGFWQTGLHGGVPVEVSECAVLISSIGDRHSALDAAGEGLFDFTPFRCFSLPSAARPLNSRRPRGIIVSLH